MSRSARASRFFFMHLGSLVAVFVYFHLCGQAGYSAEGVTNALLVALVVKSGYMAIAARRGELKQFDFALWTMFAVGTVGAYAGVGPVLRLFQRYSPAILFVTFALTALVPLLLGREPFTYYYARRQVPRWQLELPVTDTLNRVMAGYWTLIFFGAAALSAWAPQDLRFTLLYPNLLILVGGLPAARWLPPLYVKLFPPGLPEKARPLIMGMPFTFDRQAAGATRASIQFRVSGADAGDYHLRIAGGRCETFEGMAAEPDLTVHTPDTVWVRIARGELDGARALLEGQYRAEGDLSLLASMNTWFPRRR
jgi:hypothetical protein